ncbi:unnamed protein product, partial [Brassica oleracea var. botrytis]
SPEISSDFRGKSPERREESRRGRREKWGRRRGSWL